MPSISMTYVSSIRRSVIKREKKFPFYPLQVLTTKSIVCSASDNVLYVQRMSIVADEYSQSILVPRRKISDCNKSSAKKIGKEFYQN